MCNAQLVGLAKQLLNCTGKAARLTDQTLTQTWRKLFFQVISEACTMVLIQCSLRYSTTSAFSTGLTEVMPFCPGRTPWFANYGILLLTSLQKQEGFSTFFSATVLIIIGRKDCVQKAKWDHLWLPSKHLSFNGLYKFSGIQAVHNSGWGHRCIQSSTLCRRWITHLC